MGDGDQRLRPLPGGTSLQIDNAVFRGQKIYLAAGRSNDIPVELGLDPGVFYPMAVRMYG